jgi:hypothetical protein
VILDHISVLENTIWIVSPIIFSLISYLLFKFATKNRSIRLFILFIILSIVGYLYIRPRCAGIGAEQIVCTAKVSSVYNFIIFLFAFILSFVLNRLKSIHKNPKSRY